MISVSWRTQTLPLRDAKSDQTAATRKSEDIPCSAVISRFLGPKVNIQAENV